jgi:hypothetical protein
MDLLAQVFRPSGLTHDGPPIHFIFFLGPRGMVPMVSYLVIYVFVI